MTGWTNGWWMGHMMKKASQKMNIKSFTICNFVSELTYLALALQQSVLSLVPFQVSLLGFPLLVSVAFQITSRFYTYLLVLLVPLLFLQVVVNKDVWHIKIFPKLGDVQVTFGILF
jgi:hypothetical protein